MYWLNKMVSLQLMYYSYLHGLTLYAGVLYMRPSWYSFSSWPHSDITTFGCSVSFSYSSEIGLNFTAKCSAYHYLNYRIWSRIATINWIDSSNPWSLMGRCYSSHVLCTGRSCGELHSVNRLSV